MPRQKPHRSEQAVQTPRDFLDAVEERFGRIYLDLAATRRNRVTHAYYGPRSHLEKDALAVAWPHHRSGLLWLNPPFGDITPWAFRCSEQRHRSKVGFLVPASVGASWFREFVTPYAYVFELAPRLKFVGHSSAYPKDLVFAMYTPEGYVGREAWLWREAGP